MNDDPLRLKLHTELVNRFPGIKIYFRPSSKINIQYPCIVYTVLSYQKETANNETYITSTTFRVTFMSILPGKSESQQLFYIKNSRFQDSYISDDVVHDVYDITLNQSQ